MHKIQSILDPLSLTKKDILQRARTGEYQFSDVFMRHWVLSLGEPRQ